jgi:diguanylate cyclase (GGDEF)-like protein
MSLPAGRSSFRFLIAVAVGLTCSAALAIALTIWWLRWDAIRDAGADASKLATVLAEQTNRSVQSIDIVLTDIKGQMERRIAAAPDDVESLLRSEGTNKLLKERLSHLSQSERVFLVDKNGRSVNTTVNYPLPEIDLSDRDYYRHFTNNNDGHIFISQILGDRRTGQRLVVFTRRMNGANNEFLGVVVISAKFSYFESIYQSIASLHGQYFLLVHRDGTMIVRYPDPKSRAGQKMPANSLWYKYLAQGGGYFRTHSVFDGEARLISLRPLRDYPLVVNVATSEDAALAVWRKQATVLGIGTLLFMLCSGLLLKALSRQFRRFAASEASLTEHAHELKNANSKVDAALNHMSQGLVMFDSSGHLVVSNQRYIEMYGLPPEAVRPGCSLRNLLNRRAADGAYGGEDIEQYIADIHAAIGQGNSLTKITELPDGRIICIVSQPIADGGWVATHEDITEAKRAEERISHAAHHDALTGLPNRKLFSEQLEQALKRVRRGERLAVLYLDLDHLKRINDTLGHAIGDNLLKGVAERLRRSVRDIDLVARLSGDEFAIIQTSIEQPANAADLAVRVREAIHAPFDFNGHQVVVDISVGISIAPNDATELNELLKTADIALYEAKNTGRGTYCFYEPDMNARMQSRDKLERDLQSALANGEFELFYQPVVTLKETKIRYFEALLRWHHPTRGLVSPTEFIPIAEETGFIVPLGEWVLRQACAEAANWPDNIGVAVNISSVQLANKNLANAVVGAIASASIPAERLIIEITESVFLRNTFGNLATLRRLHELGVQFAMDDFGTGYSSLGYLLSFPFSKIKIDRSFVTDLPTRKESRAIVRAIIDLARSLKIEVVAEGVETGQQMEQLRKLGCTEIQGYLFSPPRPVAEIHKYFLPDGKASKGVASIASEVA